MSNFSTFFPAGGGGGTPVGGFSFFNTPVTTTFTAGKEVYTDPDNLVWIKTGALIDSTGTGALDASNYPLVNQPGLYMTSQGNFSTQAQVRANRYGIVFTGKHIMIKGYNNSSNDYLIYDINGTLIDGPTATTDTSVSISQFHNNTHTFILSPCGSNFGYSSSPTSVRYLLTSSLTNYASYAATPLKTWNLPTGILQTARCAVTNSGGANERYWWNSSNFELREYTFNSSAATNTIPWTATGNVINTGSISLASTNPIAVGNVIYLHKENQLTSFDATTFQLITTETAPGGAWAVQQQGQSLAIIPAYVSASTNNEYILTQATTSPPSSFPTLLTNTWQESPIVAGPTANDAEVFLTDNSASYYNIKTNAGRTVPMWQRIA